MRRRSSALPAAYLTRRELEYLTLAALGWRQKEIAIIWGRSISTPKRIGASALHKLGVDSTIDALRAIGWLKVPIDRLDDAGA